MRSRTCGLHRCTASSTTLTSSLTKSKAWANRKMILERQDLAWVKSADGRLTPFDEARLIASIQTAARRAGHENELLAESVAGAIHLYARDCTGDQTVAASEIENIVASVLCRLDYDDVASAYSHRRQLAEIHLDELVARSGPAFE